MHRRTVAHAVKGNTKARRFNMLLNAFRSVEMQQEGFWAFAARSALMFVLWTHTDYLAAQASCPNVSEKEDSGAYVANLEGNWNLVRDPQKPPVNPETLFPLCHLPLRGAIQAEQHRTKFAKIVLADATSTHIKELDC